MTGQPETPGSEQIHLKKAKEGELADLCKTRHYATESGEGHGNLKRQSVDE